MFSFKVLGLFLVAAITVNFIFNFKFEAEPENNQAEIEPIAKETVFKKIIKSSHYLNPFSQKKVVPLSNAEVTRSRIDREQFAEIPSATSNPTPNKANESVFTGANLNSSPTLERGKIENSRNQTSSNSNSMTNSQNLFKEPTPLPSLMLPPQLTDENNNKKDDLIVDLPVVSTPGSSNESEPNTCTASTIAGSFSNPIGITLRCSIISTIKYCVGIGNGSGCCDPLISSSTYSSQIVIGPKNGNYCLSYYGEAKVGDSVVYQHNYTINTTLPNLLVAHPKIVYQTTQLIGKSLITSSDFGRTGFHIGQVNLLTRDPGPAGDNLDCDQIVNSYTTMTAPSPLAILGPLDVGLDSPATQIEIPLRAEHLEYGDNFITSFIADSNFVAPVHACSTSKVILSDFVFFQAEPTFSMPATGTVTEFSGGFSSLGFFEEETTVFRGPAGASIEDNTGQNLQYGMFALFYQ